MSGYTRRYLQDPGTDEILAIEGIVIIDREPASPITGAGSGVVTLVAEWENGDFNTPTEVFGGQDILNQFGGFGFNYNGVGGNNPCARARKADGAAKDEYWNGNGYVALVGKSFKRLILTRVDTTVGEVSFTRLAYLTGGYDLTWNLDPGQILTVKVDGSSHNVTWDAAVAGHLGTAGSYPYAPAGGETMTVVVDEGTANAVSAVVTFTAADTTQAAVMSRINTALGFAFATDGGSSKIQLTGRVAGTSGNIRITQITSSLATAIGLTVASYAGTGDVANIDSVTFAEVKARIEGDATGTLVERNAAGQIQVASIATTGTPTIEIVASTTTVVGAFGFPLDTSVSPLSNASDGKLPAGVQVLTSDLAHSWTTAKDVAITALSAGPYKVRVRPTNDNGSETAALPGVVNTIGGIPADVGMWAVTNVLALGAALSESALDAAYIAAIDSTKNPNTVAKQDNIIWSARQSNAIRGALRTNAIKSSERMFGRMGIVRPPLGTPRVIARSTAMQPGVGAYRDQRVVYAYPGVNVYVPQIARLGTSGGAGFTKDGIVDVGFDGWVAAICASLPPEEDPGQVTTAATAVLGIERGNPDVQALTMDDYIAFKAAGICAPAFDSDDGVCTIQSSVTSVDPLTYPALVNIARRRMADYIQDSLAVALKAYTKKMNTKTRRSLVTSSVNAFLSGLLSKQNADLQRIAGYTLNPKDGNTPDTLGLGIFRLIIKVRTLAAFKDIVLDTEIGENVLNILEAA